MIVRQTYLDFLNRWKNKKVIKVVSGIRRCGKSTLFKQFIDTLEKNNVKPQQIVFINFEDISNDKLLDSKKLYDYLLTKISKNKTTYIFLDEIQHVKDFYKVIDSLYIKDNVDLYITGSNSYFMSSQLATLLTGRYVELKMLPLSFKEYNSFYKSKDLNKLFLNYITNGSFPYGINLESAIEYKEYMEGILNTILLNDVIPRKNISNVPYLKNVFEYLCDNIGNITSIKKICDTMKSNHLSSNNVTLGNYIEGLCEALLIYRVNRYDIAGKNRLVQSNKYYLSDVSFRYQTLGHINDLGRIVENIVFLELKRRYSDVYVGKIGTNEVDFVVRDDKNQIQYFQVCLELNKNNTNRELLSLKQIKDNNPKTIIVLYGYSDNIDGIKVINLFDWLNK